MSPLPSARCITAGWGAGASDPNLFWDEEEERLTITTKDRVIRMRRSNHSLFKQAGCSTEGPGKNNR